MTHTAPSAAASARGLCPGTSMRASTSYGALACATTTAFCVKSPRVVTPVGGAERAVAT